jgi:hypothetical protein
MLKLSVGIDQILDSIKHRLLPIVDVNLVHGYGVNMIIRVRQCLSRQIVR